jgi:hypothetical protein
VNDETERLYMNMPLSIARRYGCLGKIESSIIAVNLH